MGFGWDEIDLPRKKGKGFMLIGDKRCKLVAVSSPETGKLHFIGIDINSGDKVDGTVPSSQQYLNFLGRLGLPTDEELLKQASQLADLGDARLRTDPKLLKQINHHFDDGKDLLVSVTPIMGGDAKIDVLKG